MTATTHPRPAISLSTSSGTAAPVVQPTRSRPSGDRMRGLSLSWVGLLNPATVHWEQAYGEASGRFPPMRPVRRRGVFVQLFVEVWGW
ncbi:hypothetical protein BIGA_1789 [Bifidobacterium pullorum subsp. gallinarum]|uniref:Uncharacterized protein n=1 Tax=Bifidobacterium pullorum subsp. gallinarum TaxID=78344 RepID=A0A087AL05_9BIFI|nr:hypothetical protein BIGA_1789 [Bifidobacterium pullorum subsp. gallinarum]